ncbi:MAG: phosphate signaling complex protein PhoU [Clostridiaceae bacterium]|nr:phosphate signaling complex protein PhoU [Clostridiaceae bacterium]
MRSKFDEQLEYLNVELIKMGALCEEAISSAIKALLDDDREMSRKARDTDREIDQKERDIEALCLKLLLQQQPVARDLRVISSALKMISDMERIGDQAADIAEITSFIIGSNAQGRIHLRDMALAAINMVTESIDSFVKKDMALAEHVIQADDVVDALFLKVKTELISLIQNDNGGTETYLDLLMIAKYLERIGDHATNIAEWVLFSITGKHAES